MDSSIKNQCEQSFYEELYHYENGKCCLVMDKVSERIYFRKTLSVYNIGVFNNLKLHLSRYIPKIHSFWEEEGKLIVIEEFVSGNTLEYLLENEKPTDDQKKDYLLQICDGLIFLHGQVPQIIHRDLKASNIMVTDEGTVKIIDYDAAKTFDSEQEKDTMLIGTKGCAAPEQYGFGKCDERTDIYALGVLIRQMFPVDQRMNRIADKATKLDPRERYQSMKAMRKAIGDSSLSKEDHSQFNINMRRLLSIPGFRTHTPWKMIIAIIGYLFIFSFCLSFDAKNDGVSVTGLMLWINRFAVLFMFLSFVDLYTKWTGFFDKFPLIKEHNWVLKTMGYLITTFLIAFFYAMICAIASLVIT